MKKISLLQGQEALLLQALSLEKEEMANDAAGEEEEEKERRRKHDIQEQIDDEMQLQQEEARRRHTLEDFTKDASKLGLPRSFVRLQEHQCSKLKKT